MATKKLPAPYAALKAEVERLAGRVFAVEGGLATTRASLDVHKNRIDNVAKMANTTADIVIRNSPPFTPAASCGNTGSVHPSAHFPTHGKTPRERANELIRRMKVFRDNLGTSTAGTWFSACAAELESLVNSPDDSKTQMQARIRELEARNADLIGKLARINHDSKV